MELQVIASGQVLGQRIAEWRASGVVFSETTYRAGTSLPRHAHEDPYFCLVVDGAYRETLDRHEHECVPSMLLFHPAGAEHHDFMGSRPVRCFNVSLPRAWIEGFGPSASRAELAGPLTTPAALGIARRLHAQLRREPPSSSRRVEELAQALCASLFDPEPSVARGPDWLSAALAILSTRRPPPTLTEISRELGVHPVHACRTFHAHVGVTIGEYGRRLRVERARRALVASDDPLAEIALEAGFSDQSHLGREFRRCLGTSPALYRRTRRPPAR